MHAVEKYEGVLEKLRESSAELEGMKDTARDVSVAFDEIKKHRQQLFQGWSNIYGNIVGNEVYYVIESPFRCVDLNPGLFPACFRSVSYHLQRPHEEFKASIGYCFLNVYCSWQCLRDKATSCVCCDRRSCLFDFGEHRRALLGGYSLYRHASHEAIQVLYHPCWYFLDFIKQNK